MNKIEKMAGDCLKDLVHSYHLDPDEWFACMIMLKEGETLGYDNLSKFVSDVSDLLGIPKTDVVISLERGQLSIGFPLFTLSPEMT